jgi:hypothetical protein
MENSFVLFSLINMFNTGVNSVSEYHKVCCETSTCIFPYHGFCSGKMHRSCKSGLRRVDLHNGQKTAAPFANNGTVMGEE